ncbi:RNA polymerase sigma factor [Streptomyces sp. NPDC029674]|uniref:RNA polymerase sigma factor n=1 Tax=Streptomyces sp. NPDC029674 TaxID=3365297 RepID=UPI00384E5B30
MTSDERDGPGVTASASDSPESASASDAVSDDELLVRAAHDASAFEPLVRRHAPALHGYFARRAPGAADDLLAEAWLQAYTARRGFDAARGPARAWLFGVARNVLSAHWRRSCRQRPGPAGDGRDDPWEAVDERLDAAAVAPRLRALLAELPPDERELLLLVAWEQLTPGEAAAVVGIPAGTARSRLHRARRRLRADAPLKLTGDPA